MSQIQDTFTNFKQIYNLLCGCTSILIYIRAYIPCLNHDLKEEGNIYRPNITVVTQDVQM